MDAQLATHQTPDTPRDTHPGTPCIIKNHGAGSTSFCLEHTFNDER